MKRNMTAKTRRKPKGQMSKRESENALWGMVEEFVIDGDLFSFTDHGGINVRNAPPDQGWDTCRGHYGRGEAGADFENFLFGFSTWGPIASRVVELQLGKTRNAAGD